MHRLRLQVVIRILFLFLVLAGGVYYVVNLVFESYVPKRASSFLSQVEIPPDNLLYLLREVTHLLSKKQVYDPFIVTVQDEQDRLFKLKDEKKKNTRQTNLNVSLIFRGKNKYALINDEFYSIGDVVPGVGKIKDISFKGVLIVGFSGQIKILHWTNPMRVELHSSLQENSQMNSQQNSVPVSKSTKKEVEIEKILELLKNVKTKSITKPGS
ncbi:MAG: hypothetical protein Q9M37_01625 [Desulfonauticus sp.]|nr:hypothetical protein [Desulfonauticus sp.]